MKVTQSKRKTVHKNLQYSPPFWIFNFEYQIRNQRSWKPMSNNFYTNPNSSSLLATFLVPKTRRKLIYAFYSELHFLNWHSWYLKKYWFDWIQIWYLYSVHNSLCYYLTILGKSFCFFFTNNHGSKIKKRLKSILIIVAAMVNIIFNWKTVQTTFKYQ